MPLQNPQDVAAHSALDTGVHGVTVGVVCSETELADAIALKHATGTYDGNATDDRVIQTGFLCKCVIIQLKHASTPWTWLVLNTSGDDCLEIKAGVLPTDLSKPYLHATNGFVLGDVADYANASGFSYAYAAFG
ncbi:unnamed protein product [marine sediment metagenome]|uniref:Uncharacterized protein n=1 Tax=marine sediment metagenome TaxID=412755 RepID=X1K1C1_9ZZZZ